MKKGSLGALRSSALPGYAAGSAIVAGCTGISMATAGVLQTAAFLMLFPLAILIVATRFGLGAAIFTTAAGLAAYDFVFVPPELAFAVPDFKNGLTLAVLVCVVAAVAVMVVRLRRQVDAARHQAEVQALRNALLSALSHDLRSPLMALLNASEALHGDEGDVHRRNEFSRMVESEVGRMSRLVGSLLDLSRLDAVRARNHEELQSIEEVVGSATRRLEPQLVGRAVSIDIALDTPLVAFDPLLIEQVIINLIENVIRHAGPRSPVELSARGEGLAVVVEVADRGPGVAPGDEARVFAKHYRTGAGPGAGLGLTICRAIIQAHGGSIALARRAGGGTVVRFSLPPPQGEGIRLAATRGPFAEPWRLH